MNFSGKFGSDQTIWYPASGCRGGYYGSLGSVGYGYYWCASPYSSDAYLLYLNYDGIVHPSNPNLRASGLSVRCLQE